MKKKKNYILFLIGILILLPGFLLLGAGKKEGAVPEKGKPTLSIICFQGYAEPSWVKPFEEANNAIVKVTYAGTVEEHFTKVKAAPEEYNIVSIDSGRVKMYYDAGLIQPIDTSGLKNYNKIGKFFREHPYANIGGKTYHVPIVWGTQTITINIDKIDKNRLSKYISPDGKTVSLDVLIAPEFKGLTAFFDESTNVVSIAAIHVGIKNPFQFKSEEDWNKVFNMLLKWKRNARTFTTGLDSEFGVMTAEDAYILLGGNDALLNLRLEEARVRSKFKQYPMTEGTICWIDGWVITKPTKGASYDLALKYMDYMIGDDGQKQLAQLVGFGIVNPEGAGGFNPVVLDSAWWYGKDISDFPAPLYIMVAEEDPGRRVELWNKVKATP